MNSTLTTSLIILFLSPLAWGATFEDYQVIRDQKKAELGKLQAQQQQLEAQYQKKIEQKNQLLKQAQSELEKAGKAKGKDLLLEIYDIRKQGRIVDQISRKYLKAQEKLNVRYQKLVSDFDEYYKSDSIHKEEFKTCVQTIQNASLAPDVGAPRVRLGKVASQERSMASFIKTEASTLAVMFRNRYSHYREKIAPYRSFMEIYHFPFMEEPRASIDRLENIISYTDKRSILYASQIRNQIAVAVQKTDALLKKEMEDWEAERSRGKERKNFIEFVGSLIDQANEAVKPAPDLPYVDVARLMPRYDNYLKIISYRPICEDLSRLKKEDSPLYLGCLLLLPMADEGKRFVESSIWVWMSRLTERLWESPEPLQTDVLILRKMKGERKDVIAAIQFHDALLKKWNDFLEAQAKGGK